jgi:CheY-like chemotaxis protein
MVGERAEAIRVEERGRTVLLLQQNREMNQAVRQALEDAGYTVWDAANGLRLISRLHVDQPDVVVMDTSGAWADCFDLCNSLKSSMHFKDVRVVLLTEGDEPLARAERCACDKVVSRASDPATLLRALDEVFALAPDPC